LTTQIDSIGLRRAVLIVAGLNLAYFFVEFFVARSIGSVSLLADSVDFLEDASVNLLAFFALSLSLVHRARIGKAMAVILLVPAVTFLWVVWQKFSAPMPPLAFELTVTGLGALAVNSFCALLLARWKSTGGGITKAAFLSARNDAIANLGIIAAGLITASVWISIWPDLIAGLAIAAMNIDAAHEVWQAAHNEQNPVA
jgi:Co/Zn/Cd efflux system component